MVKHQWKKYSYKMSQRINVLFILPSLTSGGAERVISFIANNLNRTKFKTTLMIIGVKKETVYDVSNVDVIYLGKKRVLLGFVKLFKFIFKNKPNVVVSCMTHVNILASAVLLFFPRTKLIIRESNIKSVTKIYNSYNQNIFNQLTKLAIFRSHKIVCQSNDMASELVSEYKAAKKKTVIINNPIQEGFDIKNRKALNTVPKYITIGRLHKEKGYERILQILAKLDFEFNYLIIGNGSEKENLLEIIKSHNLENKVGLIDNTSEVAQYLKESNLFLQGSYAEGFPNALLESCACGTPVVAFDVLGGTKEIVENNVNGYLVKDEDEFLKRLKEIQNNNPFNFEKVSESVYKKFASNIVLNQYESLIINTLQD
jgi:glycosyltransferase involved in cell wall biosynthesis